MGETQGGPKARKARPKAARIKRLLPGTTLLLALLLFLPGSPARDAQGMLAAFGVADFGGAPSRWPFSFLVFDVGKADALLIECEGEAMLVDAGTYGCGAQISEYLARRGLALRYVVNTHPDSDHAGGLEEVLRRCGAETFLSPPLSTDGPESGSGWREAADACREKGIPVRVLQTGEWFPLGGARVYVLGPLREYEGSNNNSLVLKVVYGERSFLLTGDAEEEAERDLLREGGLQADVLKVGHHGSASSSSAEFLAAVDPDYAVISVGPDRNELPRKEVLERLYETGAEIYRTDVNGPLLFCCDGESIRVFTEGEPPGSYPGPEK